MHEGFGSSSMDGISHGNVRMHASKVLLVVMQFGMCMVNCIDMVSLSSGRTGLLHHHI